eukprot:6278623-Heterocapsa_arctica.AAC.1
MGQQSGDLCQAGVEGQQGDVSSDYEHKARNFIKDDRSRFSLQGRQMTTRWKWVNDNFPYQYRPAQHQHQLEYLFSPRILAGPFWTKSF